jgi:hypothetical protein
MPNHNMQQHAQGLFLNNTTDRLSLEGQQGMHNSLQTTAKNISAANDQQQMLHDANELKSRRFGIGEQPMGVNAPQLLQLPTHRRQVDYINDPNQGMRQSIQGEKTLNAEAAIHKEMRQRRGR